MTRWNAFWFTERDERTLTVLRLGLGGLLFAWALSLAPDLPAFFSAGGILPEPRLVTRRPSLLSLGGDAWLFGLYGALLVAAAAVFAGWRVRVFAPLLWLLVVSFQARNPLLWNAGDSLLRVFAAYLALQAVWTGDLGGPLRAAPLGRPGRLAPYWGVRLFQLQMTAVYAFAALDKLRGETWRDGSAVPRALRLAEFQRFPVPGFVQEAPWGALLTWGTLGLELALPLLLWWPRSRAAAIAAAIAFHLALDYGLRIGFFSFAMALGCLAFLPPRAPGARA